MLAHAKPESNQIAAATVLESIAQRVEASPNDIAFIEPVTGNMSRVSWRQHWQSIQAYAVALQHLGVQPGDRVAIALPTCYLWEVFEKAAMSLGAAVVGIEPYASARQIEFVLRHSGSKLLICETCDGNFAIADGLPQLSSIVTLKPSDETAKKSVSAKRISIERIESLAKESLAKETSLDKIPVKPCDPAVLIYTSGTTGDPKGILYSHAQVQIACDAILSAYHPISREDLAICWLPLANLFQRIMNQCAAIAGTTTFLVRDPRDIANQIKIARPTVFIGVPRFYEKLYQQMMSQLNRRGLGWTIALAKKAAPSVQARRNPISRACFALSLRLADTLILAKLRQALGGRMRFMITGSAPCSRDILEFFEAIGVPLLEAYGMSENIVPNCANTPDNFRLGSVGKAMKSNDIIINSETEILIKSPGVLSGYLDSERQPEFDSNGYLKTGDQGYFDADGFLFINGRTSDLIKTSTGRRIAPLKIEQLLTQNTFIDQAVVAGDGRKYLVAIVTVDFTKDSAAIQSASELNTLRQAQIISAVTTVNAALEKHERICGCVVLDKPFSLERGEITPNLKLKRSVIINSHEKEIANLYSRIEAEPVNPNQTLVILMPS